MLIRDLTIHNFGIYGGTHTFRLNPPPSKEEKNLILFIGKNGVGKTTFVEALKLALWGALAINDRISKKDYEDYLFNRLHRSKEKQTIVEEASISILFDYVQLGESNQYFIERSWNKASNGVNEKLTIIENEKELDNLTDKEKELFLRDLFPPGYKELFFFDGEKLNMFDRKETTGILSQSIQSLLGLDTVNQLQKDISYYIKEETNNYQFDELATQYDDVDERIDNLVSQQFDVKNELQKLDNERKKIIRDHIPKTEQEITKHGRWDEEKLSELKNDKAKLEEKIEQLQKQLIDQCNGLLPFATTPRYLKKLSNQLKKEHEYRIWSISKDVINRQEKLLEEKNFKQSLKKITGKNEFLDDFLKETKSQISKALSEQPLIEEDILHNFSSEDQSVMDTWIRSCLEEVPRNFKRVADQVVEAKEQLANLENNLSWSADDDMAKPLFEELANYNKRIGEIENRTSTLQEKENEIEGLIQFHALRRNNIEEKIKEKSSVSERLQLAQNTKELLQDYSEKLKKEKLKEVGQLITEKFNLLCRKNSIFDNVRVAQDDFSITLTKDESNFDKNSLSAGEKQLLSLSILWALYDVSGLPAPIIIDTPLSRLDSVHRTNLTKHFFSKAAQQMLILGTDDEIDQMITKDLSDHVSHLYEMSFDSKTGSTTQIKYDSEDIHEYLTPLIEA